MPRHVALPCLLLAAPRWQRGPGAELAHAESGPGAGLSQLDLRGGTDTAMAPPAGYLQAVLLPTLRQRLGVDVSLHVRTLRSPCGLPMTAKWPTWCWCPAVLYDNPNDILDCGVHP